jgi:hypothetical protein
VFSQFCRIVPKHNSIASQMSSSAIGSSIIKWGGEDSKRF